MKFFTFQPKAALFEALEDNYSVKSITNNSRLAKVVNNQFKTYFGYVPIFCRPYTNAFNAWTDCFWIQPSCPECLVIFESDCYNSVTLNSISACLDSEYEHLVAADSIEPCEYFVPEIRKENILAYRLIDSFEGLPQGIIYANYVVTGLVYIDLCEFFKEDCLIKTPVNHYVLKSIQDNVLNTDLCRNLSGHGTVYPGDIEILRSRLYDCITGHTPIILKNLVKEMTI